MLWNASLLLRSKSKPYEERAPKVPGRAHGTRGGPNTAHWAGEVSLHPLVVSQRIHWELEGFDGSVVKA